MIKITKFKDIKIGMSVLYFDNIRQPIEFDIGFVSGFNKRKIDVDWFCLRNKKIKWLFNKTSDFFKSDGDINFYDYEIKNKVLYNKIFGKTVFNNEKINQN